MIKFSRFLEKISHLNGLGKGASIQWCFYPGMLFSSWDKWWDDFGTRSTIHEGIDITYYETQDGNQHQFTKTTQIPALDSGKILNICNDFLGQTLVIEHPESGVSTKETEKTKGKIIIYAYAHINPNKLLKIGGFIQKDDPIATVCSTVKNPKLPPHLHLSCFEVPSEIPCNALNWDLFSKIEKVHSIHPWFL